MDGNTLKKLREERGLSLSRLSEQTGISKSYLSLIEREIQRNPSIDIVEKLAKTFRVEVEQLINNEKEQIKTQPVKSVLKLEIELTEDQINPQKLKQIKEFIQALNASD